MVRTLVRFYVGTRNGSTNTVDTYQNVFLLTSATLENKGDSNVAIFKLKLKKY